MGGELLPLVAMLAAADPIEPVATRWRVECQIDQITAIRTCLLKGGDDSIPFWVGWEDKNGPFVFAGHNDFPGKKATVRVDGNKPHTFDPKRGAPAKLIEELRRGRIVLFQWYEWPDDVPRSHGYSLDGYAAAFEAAVGMQKKGGESTWPPPVKLRINVPPNVQVTLDDYLVSSGPGLVETEPGRRRLHVWGRNKSADFMITLESGVVNVFEWGLDADAGQ